MTLPIFPYQQIGAEFLAGRARAGLFDEPGVGKTAQTIRALDLRGFDRGIVVCPAVARENWRGEFAKFGTRYRRICKGVTIHDFVAWSHGLFDVLVTSFDMMVRWAKYLHERCEPLQFMVIDEAHYLKEAETLRAKQILGTEAAGHLNGATMWAECAWWLTGTPVPNDPADIYTFLRFQQVMPLGKQAFVKRYFTSRPRTFSSSQRPKPEMLGELQSLIGNNSLRRTLAQTGVELPPIFVGTHLVDGDAEPVRQLLLAHPGLDGQIRAALEAGSLAGINADHVATLRRLIGEAKAVPYAATLLGEIESGLDKMVSFGVHRAALTTVRDYLTKHGVGCALINGDTSEKDRQIAMHEFQHNPGCKVLLANIRAAGTALTLTASARLDMLESDWTPANNYQAIKRVHRISQTRSVRVRLITLAQSFDEVVNDILRDKSANIALMEAA